jgi:RimJ/RimL family protein N-acetyltransferase
MHLSANEAQAIYHGHRRPWPWAEQSTRRADLIPFSPGHLADLDLPPQLRPSLRLFATAWRRAGPALTVLDNGKVVACAGLMIEGSDAMAWAFLSLSLRARARRQLYRSFRRALPKLKRCHGLERITAETHPDHRPSRLWLEHLGFRFDGLGPRCPILGERPLRYLYR